MLPLTSASIFSAVFQTLTFHLKASCEWEVSVLAHREQTSKQAGLNSSLGFQVIH